MPAKIGVFAVGLEAYWPQFAGVKDGLLGHHKRLREKFAGWDVVDAGMVDNVNRAREAGLKFKAADVDIIFCHLTTYSSSDTLLPVIRPLRDVPVVILNVQVDRAMDLDKMKEIGDWLGTGCTCAGFPEMPAALRRFEYPFSVLTGHLVGDGVLDAEIRQWCLAAEAKNRLRCGEIGILGRPYQGMMDLNVDETNIFRRFGSYVRHLNWEDLAAIVEVGAPAALVEEGKMAAREVFDVPADIDDKHLASIGEVYAATVEIAGKYNLVAMCNHCEVVPSGAFAKVIAASNPVFSLMARRGVACPVECDVKVAIAITLLRTVGGSATLAELYSMDFEHDVCIVGHSGAGDPAIGDGKASLKMSEVFHGKPGSGFLTQFFPAPGPATLVGLTQDPGGDYRLIVAEGEIVPGKAMQLGDTNSRFRFRRGLRDFADGWAMRGPTHHSTLGRGHHAANLVKMGLMFGMPVDVI